MTGRWSSKPEWPSIGKAAEDILKHDSGITKELLGVKPKIIGWDLGKDDKTVVVEGEFAKGILKITDIREATEEDKVAIQKVYNNKMPTHDPYTNPNVQVYYECKCGAILDPGTKSFAALNNCASEKGWKIRFGERGYTPYCVECGKEVE